MYIYFLSIFTYVIEKDVKRIQEYKSATDKMANESLASIIVLHPRENHTCVRTVLSLHCLFPNQSSAFLSVAVGELAVSPSLDPSPSLVFASFDSDALSSGANFRLTLLTQWRSSVGVS